MQITALIALLSAFVVTGELLSLTEENWHVNTAGKSVFIRFHSSWFEESVNLTSDWEKLAQAWMDHPFAVIADVDCTEENPICQDFEIEDIPTFYHGDGSAPKIYNGGQDVESLVAFATENLSKRHCSIYALEACSEEQKNVNLDLDSQSLDDVRSKMNEIIELVTVEANVLNEKVNDLNAAYDQLIAELNDKVEEIHQKYHERQLKAVFKKKGGKLKSPVEEVMEFEFNSEA